MKYVESSKEQGPFPCEYPGCTEPTRTIALTEKEYEMLPEKIGPKAMRFIYENNLGRAICHRHR